MPSGDQINLRHLRATVEVGRLGSVTLASGTTNMSQPAITQAIAKIEALLGARLFLRSSKGMTPTGDGEIFVRRAARALEFLREGGARAGWRQGAQVDAAVTTTQLRALIAVATHGSYSVAARATGTAQPSLHRSARDLERISGVPLFQPTPEGVRLSHAARHVLMAAKLAFAEIDQAIAELAVDSGAGRLRIGSMPLSRSAILPAVIDGFAARHPQIAIQVIDGPYDDLLHGLRHGEIDLIVGALRDPAPAEDVVQVPLFTDRLGVVCAPDHPLAGAVPQLADLIAYPWVLPRAGTPTRAQFDRVFGAPEGRGPVVETSSMVLVERLLASGPRLTVISRTQVRDLVADGRMVALPVDLGDPPRAIGWTVRASWQATAAQQDMLDLLTTGWARPEA